MSNKLLHLAILLFAPAGTAEAQVSTMYAMPVGASYNAGLYVVVCGLFSGSVTGSGYEVSAGVAQAQLECEDYVETVSFDEDKGDTDSSKPAPTGAPPYYPKSVN